MKSKSMTLLLVAAGCGLVAMIGVQQMLSGGTKAAPKVKIVVARTEIEAGVRLDRTNVMAKEWPADAMPEGAITKEEEFTDRALKHRVVPGQPILLTELGNKGEFGLNIQIPPEMRVVTFPVTATMTHSGMLRPGDFVDVTAALEMPAKGGGKRTEVKPVLQCIQVFAVGSRVVGTEESKDPKKAEDKNVSFLVYPLQAQLMQLAYKQSNGQLQFALRSSSDKAVVNSGDLNDQSLTTLANSLMGYREEPEQKATQVKEVTTVKPKSAFRSYVAPETSKAVTSVGEQAARRTWKLEIFQGDQREVQEFDWPETDVEINDQGSGNDSNPLLKFFNRRQKSDSTSALKTQPTSIIRRDAETETNLEPTVSIPTDEPSLEQN